MSVNDRIERDVERDNEQEFLDTVSVKLELRRQGGVPPKDDLVRLANMLNVSATIIARVIKQCGDLEVELNKKHLATLAAAKAKAPPPNVVRLERRLPKSEPKVKTSDELEKLVSGIDTEKVKLKLKEEEEAEQEEVDEPEGEGEFVEDDTNAANDVRRKLWRLQSALGVIDPTIAGNIQAVGSVLWRMSISDRSKGEAVWMDWLTNKRVEKEKARAYWDAGFEGAKFCSVEKIYRAAQAAGWRYPIARNLNRLEETVEQTEKALIRADADIYQSAKRLVRPVQVQMPAAAPAGSNKARMTNVTTLEPITEPWLKSALTRYVDFFTWGKGEHRNGVAVHADITRAMIGRYGLWEFPIVTGVVTAPTLRPDGSLLSKKGWDKETGLLLLGPLPFMPPLADEPTQDDARKAIGMLDALLMEFPFVDRGSRSAALSGLITPVVRGALKCVPGHSVSAPEPATGKSYLTDIAAAIAIGNAMPIIATGGQKEELEKRIDAQVFSGVTLWSLDNVSTPIGGDALCQAIERPNYGARVLGQSEIKMFLNNWSIYITGNALKIKNDATRRILRSNLDARQEKPEYRKFKGDPYNEVLAHRGRYLWAVLTVVRAYIVAGKPGCLPWVGEPFGAWSDLVRSPLVWLDYEDPFVTTEATRENDPDRQSRAAMLQAILSAYGSKPEEARTASQMIEDAERAAFGSLKSNDWKQAIPSNSAKNLKVAIEDYLAGNRINPQHFGNKLNKDHGRITDGLKLCAIYNSSRKVNSWYVEKVNA